MEKDFAPVPDQGALGDRASLGFSGTLVTSGQGAGIAVATGSTTELGKVSALLGGVQTLTTPLLDQMNRFGRWLTIIIVAVARSEEHTSELQSLMRISYAVFCLKKKTIQQYNTNSD